MASFLRFSTGAVAGGDSLGSGNVTGSVIVTKQSLDALPASLWRPWFHEEICGLQLLEREKGQSDLKTRTHDSSAPLICVRGQVSVFGPVKSHRCGGGQIGQNPEASSRHLVRR